MGRTRYASEPRKHAVAPRYTAEKGNQGLALRPVGTGPYRFVELVKDERLVVEAFDRHWRGAPRIQRIVFKPIPEPFTRAAARTRRVRPGRDEKILTSWNGLMIRGLAIAARALERPELAAAATRAVSLSPIVREIIDHARAVGEQMQSEWAGLRN